MHIISLRMLRDFWRVHPAAEGVLRHWHSIAEATVFDDFNDLRRTFRSADYVSPYTVFNVGGNITYLQLGLIGLFLARRCATAVRA